MAVDSYTYGTVAGQIRSGAEIGYSGKYANKYIWSSCADCGKERWVRLENGVQSSARCRECGNRMIGKANLGKLRGSASGSWKGGRRVNKAGYVMIRINPEDPFFPMSSNGYVFEHRLVVARALGRCLKISEIVHHKHNMYSAGSLEDKQDNRYPENLELVDSATHDRITILENRIKALEARVILLEADNVLLRGEI